VVVLDPPDDVPPDEEEELLLVDELVVPDEDDVDVDPSPHAASTISGNVQLSKPSLFKNGRLICPVSVMKPLLDLDAVAIADGMAGDCGRNMSGDTCRSSKGVG
jgi:hypothetical protein